MVFSAVLDSLHEVSTSGAWSFVFGVLGVQTMWTYENPTYICFELVQLIVELLATTARGHYAE